MAVAYGAQLFGLKATICVPEDANPDKLAGIESHGAHIVKFGDAYDNAYQKALELQRKTGATFIHAFDDPDVIAGQGTVGIEIFEDLREFNTVIVPIGGGGLISGVSVAIKQLKPEAKVIGVEPRGVPSMYNSFRSGRRVEVKEATTIADGLLAKKPGKLTLRIVKRYVDKIVLVTEDQLKLGILTLLRSSHVLAEAAGAAALAALLHEYKPGPDERCVLIVSGANISFDLLSSLLSGQQAK